MTNILTYIAIILSVAFSEHSKGYDFDISGQITRPENQIGSIQTLDLIVKQKSTILGVTQTDKEGRFKLSITLEKKEPLDLMCIGLGIDTLYLCYLQLDTTNAVELHLKFPAEIRKNFLGQVICPKCNRPDKVYPIRYGDPVITTIKTFKDGSTQYSPIYKGKYQAGCLVGPAQHYCDRDKIKF